MKKYILLTFICLIGLSGISFAQTQKMAFVDLQRVIRDSEAGKSAKSSFEKEFQSKRQIIEQKATALENLRQDFIKNGAVSSESKRKSMAFPSMCMLFFATREDPLRSEALVAGER